MSNKMALQVEQIGSLIRTIRGQKVILDYDLARILASQLIVSMRL